MLLITDHAPFGEAAEPLSKEFGVDMSKGYTSDPENSEGGPTSLVFTRKNNLLGDHPITRGLNASFDVEDEPYFIELQDPGSIRILLSADYGPDAVSPSIGTIYASDTSLQSDGKTRVLGYAREVGKGGVAYVALGHCHSPAIRAGRADPADPTPATFHGAWESDAFIALLRNAIGWGLGRD